MSGEYRSPITGKGVSEKSYIVKRLKEKYNLDVVSYDPNCSYIITARNGDLRGDIRYYYSRIEIPLWLALKMCRNF